MKKIFVNTIYKNEPDYDILLNEIEKVVKENSIALCYSNQFINIAKKIKDKTSKEVVDFIQTLGCSNPKFSEKASAIVIVGQGKFHSVSLAYESGLATYIVSGNNVKRVADEDIEKMRKKEMGAILKYLNSERVGILVSSKPGQNRLKAAIELKKKIKDKKCYIFIANDINTSEFENFNIDCFVNSACPRMDLNEGNIINYKKLKL